MTRDPFYVPVADAVTNPSDAPSGRPARPLLRGTLLSDIEARDIEWWMEPMVPRGTSILVVGAGGVGKSTLTSEWAAMVTRGEAPLGSRGFGRPRGAVMIAREEDGPLAIRPRMERAGADLSRVEVFHSGDEELPTIPDDLDAIEAAVERVDAGVVVIDTGMDATSERLDLMRTRDVGAFFHPLNRLAADRDLIVFVLHHENQSRAESVVHKATGIAAWVNKPRAVLMVAVPDNLDQEETDERVVGLVKANLGTRTGYTSRFRIVDRGPLPGRKASVSGAVHIGDIAREGMRDHYRQRDDASPAERAADAIVEVLTAHPLGCMISPDANAAMSARGLTDNAIRQGKQAAEKAGRIERRQPPGFPRGLYLLADTPTPEPCVTPGCDRPALRGRPCPECMAGDGPGLTLMGDGDAE